MDEMESYRRLVGASWRIAFVAFLTVAALGGCGGGGGADAGTSEPPPPPVANAPVITKQPESLDVGEGTVAELTVAATANGTLTFQWRFNGAAIDGATSSTLTFGKGVLKPTHSGAYDCVATNSLDDTTASTTSEPAILDVIVAPTSIAISGENAVLPGSTGHTVSIAEHAGVSYDWSITNGTITAGQGTPRIEYSAGHLGKVVLTATAANLGGTVVAIKDVVVVASLPIVNIFAQSAVLPGTSQILGSTPTDTGHLFGWTLQNLTASAVIDGSPSMAELAYDAGADVGSYQLSVNVSDAVGRSGTDMRTVAVVDNTFLKDSRDVAARSMHTATLLNDGRVLVVGGDGGVPDFDFVPVVGLHSRIVATVELFDPATETWAMVEPLPSARFQHSATLLNDGRVLVVGGSDDTGSAVASAIIYDPIDQQWSSATSLANARRLHLATLLADGRVLVTGGVDANGTMAIAEVYDPEADAWSPAGTMATDRVLHSATLLANGEVLVAAGQSVTGGRLDSAEFYDPAANSWRPAASMPFETSASGAVLLASGKVFHLGSLGGGIYDPASDTWQTAMPEPCGDWMDGKTAILLADGRVVAAGSFHDHLAYGQVVLPVSIYDPIARCWSQRTLGFGANHSSITELRDGRVLAIGGIAFAGTDEVPVAELFVSVARAAVFTPHVLEVDVLGSQAHSGAHAASVVRADGRVLVTGGSDTRPPFDERQRSGLHKVTAVTDLFDPATNEWSQVASMGTKRAEHTLTALPNGHALAVGGNNGLHTVHKSAERYDPAADAWSAAGSMTNERFRHTATLLDAGRVLVVGGKNTTEACCMTFLGDADIYDPATNVWSATGQLITPRHGHTAVLLVNGKVLVAGGFGGKPSTIRDDGAPLANSEIYDPQTGTWSETGPMTNARVDHTATALPSGAILVTGGDTGAATTATAEVYDPASGTWAAVASMSTPRQSHSAVRLSNDAVLVVGGLNDSSSAVFGVEGAEVYDPVANSWMPAGTIVTPRQHFTLDLLGDGRVLLNGGLLIEAGLPEFYR